MLNYCKSTVKVIGSTLLSSVCKIDEQLFYTIFINILEQNLKRKEHYDFQRMCKYGIRYMYHDL